MIIMLIPAYNEAHSLPSLFPKIEAALKELGVAYKLIVCNDGSTDNTGELLTQYAQSMPIEIITHKMNRGLGETIRDLFEKAAEISSSSDYIIRFDCDDTHEPKFIANLIEKIDEGFDVVIASRFQPNGGQKGVNWYRSFISRCANLYMKIFLPIQGVRDYSCGYRAYRAVFIKQAINIFGNNFIQLKGVGFTCTIEKLIKLKLLGAKFAEIPFLLRYDQKQSDSKMISSLTTLGYFLLVLLHHWPSRGWRRSFKKIAKNTSSKL